MTKTTAPPEKAITLTSFHPARGGTLQRKCACGGKSGPAGACKNCRRKRLRRLSASPGAPGLAPPLVHDVLRTPGRPLDSGVRDELSILFGHDFRSVRVHTDDRAAQSADAVHARAYTVGHHIVFARDQYDPVSQFGRGVLAHELTHVVQQSGTAPRLTALSVDGPDGGAAEREADAMQRTVDRGGLPLPIRIHASAGIYRLPGSPAGGCGLCYGGTHTVGRAAHRIIQASFLIMYPFLLREHQMPVLTPAPGDQENGYLDLAELTHYDRISIGEIKPDNAQGRQDGQNDLNWYQREIEAYGFQVDRMNLPPPLEALPFLTLAPPDCPQVQVLYVNAPENGLYTYWCTPDFRDLIRICDCHEGRRRRQPDEVDVPVPVPVPQPRTEPRDVPVPVPQPHGVREPVPVPRPGPVEEPVPGPRQPQPEESPEQPVEPPEVIPFPGRRPQPETRPEEAPEEELPLAAMVALATMLALSLNRTVREGASRLLGQAASRVVTRALIYAEAAAAIALILAYPERVEARPGPGESAMEALFRAMNERGTPIPDELRERIENDPELRRIFEEGATTGDWSAAQEAVNRDIVQLINDHPGEFSDEDLRLLMESSEATGVPSARPSVEELRAAVEAARQGRRKTPGADETTPGEPAPTPSPARPEGGTAPAGADQYPGLTAETRQRLAGAPTPVRSLFDAMVGRSGSGPAVTDEAVERFLRTVPADLSAEEQEQLIQRLRPVQGQTLDQILGGLSQAIEQIRGGTAEEAQTDEPAAQPSPPPESQPEARITQDEYVRQMVDSIRGYQEWESISEESIRLSAVGDTTFGSVRTGGTVDTVCYLKGPASNGQPLRAAATARLRFVSRTGTRPGATFVGEVVSSTPWVVENGHTASGPVVGRRISLTIE